MRQYEKESKKLVKENEQLNGLLKRAKGDQDEISKNFQDRENSLNEQIQRIQAED